MVLKWTLDKFALSPKCLEFLFRYCFLWGLTSFRFHFLLYLPTARLVCEGLYFHTFREPIMIATNVLSWLFFALIAVVGVGAILPQKCENQCASVVSKCLLLDACKCEITRDASCTCCKDCRQCLGKSFLECCSCVRKFVFIGRYLPKVKQIN